MSRPLVAHVILPMCFPYIAAFGYLSAICRLPQARKDFVMNDVAAMRQLSPVSQPISPAKFAHFVLRTGQFEKMIEWYQTVLGARIVFRDERLCFLSYDDEHHRLALINIPGLPVRDLMRSGPIMSPTPTTTSLSCCRPTAD